MSIETHETQNMVHPEHHTGSSEPDLNRAPDPNVLQRRASAPFSSVWVGASAGTGKTKVLTDRVLRLLLPREDGSPGTAAHRILCLTFTKAGASEMALRINRILGRWAVLPLDEPENHENPANSPDGKTLCGELQTLLGRSPGDAEIAAARRLFAEVIDTPGGLNIMTIHSFCQSVLGRFPLEAGLVPGFGIAEERQAKALLEEACRQVFAVAIADKASVLYGALGRVASDIHENGFRQLVQALVAERRQLQHLLRRHFGTEGLYTETCRALEIPAGQSPDTVLAAHCTDNALDKESLSRMARILGESDKKTDMQAAKGLSRWLYADFDTRVTLFSAYASVFLTQKGELRKKAASKAVTDAHHDIENIFQQEGERIQNVLEAQKKVHCACLTHDLFALGEAVLNRYDSLKTEQGVLDFDDLIFETLDLLKGCVDTANASGGQWVQYKLDQGLEHILVDEAQDTNPEQWAIIEALCDEFFAGRSAEERERTIFSVGDEKQSIYGFQRASPEEFARMHAYFATQVTQAGARWETVKLNISFRSVKSVLAAVDSVFKPVSAFGGTDGEPVRHHSFRRGQAGLVELWPLFEDDEASQEDLWTPPLQAQDKTTGAARLAAHIAGTVRKWLDDREMLPSRGRPIRPGDIMVLVRTRTAFTYQLTRALKAQGVPVGGVDRIVLNDQIAVQDMLACASFALLPEDDLTLACLLKSPLIGLSEEALYDLAHGRSSSLWEHVKAQAAPVVRDYLAMLIEEGRRSTPYDFLSMILQRPCPAESKSGLRAVKTRLGEDALEVLDELLNSALEFERNHMPLLQLFLQWQKEGGGDIKREDEDGADHMRILTVHGSKGLQAPVVILPDTTSSPGQGRGNRPGERILWPDKTGLDIPLWSPRTEYDYTMYSRAAEALRARDIAEYDRLLYVAMTRAEDRLYIGGALKSKELQDGCWYDRIRIGLERLPEIEHLDSGGLRLGNPQLHDPDRPDVKPDTQSMPATLPAWLDKTAPPEQALQAALAPSRLEDASDSALSPLKSADDFRFRRGNLTHKLLEILPDLPFETRLQATNRFLSRNAPDLDETLRADIAAETLALLDHPEFAPLFGPESLAEAPVAGFLPDGTPVRGQVDRLLIGSDDIWIIDYKTNRPPPKTPEEVPQIYRAQLESYAVILSRIYPGRTLHAGLLWTDGPCLMPIDLKGM